MAFKKLDAERAKFNLGLSGGKTNCVNEFGLYRLIMSSRKPEAKNFQRWVFHEVLPSIRKHGYYVAPHQKIIRIEGDKEFEAFKAQYPEGAGEIKRLLFVLDEYDNDEYDVITIREVVVHLNGMLSRAAIC